MVQRAESEEVRTITHEEWIEEGKKLFGEGYANWKAVCPVCGHVQSVEDFKLYRDQGATPGSAFQECIGRYCGGRSAMSDKEGQPCDYAAYGLIRLHKTEVVFQDGHPAVPVFEFAK